MLIPVTQIWNALLFLCKTSVTNASSAFQTIHSSRPNSDIIILMNIIYDIHNTSLGLISTLWIPLLLFWWHCTLIMCLNVCHCLLTVSFQRQGLCRSLLSIFSSLPFLHGSPSSCDNYAGYCLIYKSIQLLLI